MLLVALGLSAASVGLTASPAQAERGHVGIGIGIPLAPAVPPPVVYASPAYVARRLSYMRRQLTSRPRRSSRIPRRLMGECASVSDGTTAGDITGAAELAAAGRILELFLNVERKS